MSEAEFKMVTLYIDDLQAAIESLMHTADVEPCVRRALWRDAIISYCRPFSGNRGEVGKHRLQESIVPRDLLDYHRVLIATRDQLIAHTDYSQVQSFEIGTDTGAQSTMTSMVLKTYTDEDIMHQQIEEYQKLIDAVQLALCKQHVEWIENNRRTDQS